jgi:hypothetical protein
MSVARVYLHIGVRDAPHSAYAASDRSLARVDRDVGVIRWDETAVKCTVSVGFA